MVILAPIPFATFGNHEQSHTGQNYLRSLFAPVSYTHLDVYKRQDMGGAMQRQVCGKGA